MGAQTWEIACECGHLSRSRDPEALVADAQAHALDTHGKLVPAELLRARMRVRDVSGRPRGDLLQPDESPEIIAKRREVSRAGDGEV